MQSSSSSSVTWSPTDTLPITGRRGHDLRALDNLLLTIENRLKTAIKGCQALKRNPCRRTDIAIVVLVTQRCRADQITNQMNIGNDASISYSHAHGSRAEERTSLELGTLDELAMIGENAIVRDLGRIVVDTGR